MTYIEKKWTFHHAVEIEQFHTARYGAPGEKRQPKKKPTPEQVERQNQKNKEKRCRHRLRAHFDVDDYFVTMTYMRERRPSNMDAARRDFRNFTRRLQAEYRKRGAQLKWIRNIEVGSRGAWHVHMVINRIPDLDLLIRRAWPHGRITQQLLYERGEFRELAAYLTKTPKTDKRLRESNYSTSRNLPLPPPAKRTIRWRSWRKVRIRPGWYLDKESYHEGINPVTGHYYRTYTLLRYRRE